MVRGVQLTGFSNVALMIQSRGGSVVDACRVISNRTGMAVYDSANNVIGGDAASNANVIAGSWHIGLEISGAGANGNYISGNYIGVQPVGGGLQALSNYISGVYIFAGSSNIIRGSAAARQVISGNTQNGIEIWGPTSGNRIEGNYIGVDLTGNAAIPNQWGILVAGSDNIIGGTAVSNRNVISGNGINVDFSGSQATGNKVLGNFVGVNAAGTGIIAGGSGGVALTGGSSSNEVRGTATAPQVLGGLFIQGPGADYNVVAGNSIGVGLTGLPLSNNYLVGISDGKYNLIGGTNAADRNLLSGGQNSGFSLDTGASENVVQGNYIGLNSTGAACANAYYGILIGIASNNLIGGSGSGARNVISANRYSGVSIRGAGTVGNRIQGNFIGTDVTGTLAMGNGDTGIEIYNAASNVIGGTIRSEGNLISGNGTNGIRIVGRGSRDNVISGNFIATDVTGMFSISNRMDGIALENASTNLIGGLTAGERNVISGNGRHGISVYTIGLYATGGAHVVGNYIGLASNGTTRLGNSRISGGGAGVYVDSLFGTVVGGPTPAERNVIGANTYGVMFLGGGGFGNTLQGNYVGMDASGSAVASNSIDGVYMLNAASCRILGNTISGNGSNGITIVGYSVVSNVLVQGNRIGVAATGVTGPGNHGAGLYIDSAIMTQIGGTNSADGNIIAFNFDAGVAIVTNALGAGFGNRNSILGNLIYSNGYAIDLNDDAGTANDAAPDADTGANNLQNFPVVTNATQGSTTLQGRFISAGSQTYRCEFFALNVPQGAIYLGDTNITLVASGTNGFANIVFLATAPTGSVIVATATDANGNTSEFSPPSGTVKAALDGDGDGLWDAWEIRHFGSTAVQNGTGDPDGDGFNNYLEFVSDTQPTNNASRFQFAAITNSLPHHPAWVSSASRWYDLESTTNLASGVWTNIAANIVGTGGTQSYGDAADQTTRVYRVRARIP